jgi:hypothetical protein
MSKCQGLIGLLQGHKFEPRYSAGSPTCVPNGTVWGESVRHTIAIIEASKPKTYCYDICVRCGTKVQVPN